MCRAAAVGRRAMGDKNADARCCCRRCSYYCRKNTPFVSRSTRSTGIHIHTSLHSALLKHRLIKLRDLTALLARLYLRGRWLKGTPTASVRLTDLVLSEQRQRRSLQSSWEFRAGHRYHRRRYLDSLCSADITASSSIRLRECPPIAHPAPCRPRKRACPDDPPPSFFV